MANILLRQLSVYNLPQDLLASLQVRSIQASAAAAAASQDPKEPSDALEATPSTGGGLRCQACPSASFSSVEEQREHFKSDWHRYNVKARLTGRAVSAEEWDGMVEGESSPGLGADAGVSSISGSASSSSGPSDEDKDKVSRLLKRTKLAPVGEDSDEEAEVQDRQRRAHLRTAVIWFSPNAPLPKLGVPQDTQFGVHRALFPALDNAADYLGELRRMQLGKRDEEDEEEERRITLLMVAGGHFAGMVVALNPRGKTDKQLVKGAGEVKVLKHKTFHRYTTRKKQGGSQGLNDNARGRVANSAGAMLRRYGEQALQEDIRGILAEWAEDIDASERVFIRASTHGKRSFWGYDGAVLHKDDERLRVFPFPTRRPTLQELLRCWNELAYVKVSHLSSEALAAQDEAYMASIQPKKQAAAKPAPAPAPGPAPAPAPTKTPEELAREDRARRVSEMIKKGRVDALRTFWTKHAAEYPGPGLLAQAAAAGQEEVIRFFLEEVRVDPTMPLDPRGAGAAEEVQAETEHEAPDGEADPTKGQGGKRAYDVCSGKGARNVFRRVAFAHPEWYDWSAAHVPSGLSDEMEEKQDAKKAERRKGLRDKMRERERERARAEAEVEAEGDGKHEGDVVGERVDTPPIDAFRTQGPIKLGGRDVGGLAGMSAEMRARVERERRARAAEERFRNLGVPGQK